MKFNKYHKILQFTNVVRNISRAAAFDGLNDDGEPIYNEGKPKPKLTFIGTTKLHGSNAGITYTPSGGIVAMKRSALIGIDNLSAHFGFNTFVQVTNKDYFTNLLSRLWNLYCKDGDQITLFGEWAGEGIQKSVGISKLPKAFYVFGCKARNIETNEDTWIDIRPNIESDPMAIFTFDQPDIYNIHKFQTWEIEIDFNKPKLSQNKLIEITEQVEKDCPVSRQLLGKDYVEELVGEGVVWEAFYEGEKYIFKVKGAKHSISEVKKLANVDPEVVKSIYEFADYACTPNRINQGIQEVEAKEKKDTPDLLRWVANDIISEEQLALKENSLEWKQVAKVCSQRVREHFFKIVDEI